MKKLFLVLTFLFPLTFASFGKETFRIRYLFKSSSPNHKNYSVYENDEKVSGLESLNDRNILRIRFDKNNPDNILFAEKNENRYSARKFNFLTNEENVIFEFEKEIYKFMAFTENSVYWREKCGKNNDILYEYDASTGESRKIFEIADILEWQEKQNAPIISSVLANAECVFLNCYGTFADDPGSFLIDRKTWDAKRISTTCAKTSEGRVAAWWEYAFTDGKNLKSYAFDFSESCTITDLKTLEKTKCKFKKRCEGGTLILLSDDYILVPFRIKPFSDSIRNGLFKSIWTVQYTVFDIRKNKSVFGGHITRTNEKYILDAVLLKK